MEEAGKINPAWRWSTWSAGMLPKPKGTVTCLAVPFLDIRAPDSSKLQIAQNLQELGD